MAEQRVSASSCLPGRYTIVKRYSSIYKFIRASLTFLIADLGFSLKRKLTLAGQIQSRTHNLEGNGEVYHKQ